MAHMFNSLDIETTCFRQRPFVELAFPIHSLQCIPEDCGQFYQHWASKFEPDIFFQYLAIWDRWFCDHFESKVRPWTQKKMQRYSFNFNPLSIRCILYMDVYVVSLSSCIFNVVCSIPCWICERHLLRCLRPANSKPELMLLVNGARFDLGVAKSGIFLLELILSDFILFNSIPKFKSNTIHKKGWNTRFLQGANEATSDLRWFRCVTNCQTKA